MSLYDPTGSGLRVPIQYTGQGASQASTFGNLFNTAGTPLFGGAPTPSPSSLPGLPGSSLMHVPGLGYGSPSSGPMFGSPIPPASQAGRFFTPGVGWQASSANKLLSGAGKLGGFGRVVGPVAASAASNFAANQMGTGDTNPLQEAGRGFTRGAGWGPAAAAGVAAFGGPAAVAGVPMVLAASAVTGLIGAGLDLLDAGSWFGGGDKSGEENPEKLLAEAIEAAGLDPATTEDIYDQYQVAMMLADAEPDETQREEDKKAIFQQASQMVLMKMQEKEMMGGAGAGGGNANMLALQSQAQDIFAPLASDIEQSSVAYGNAMKGIREYLPEQFRAINDATVARELTSADRLANAYRAQASVVPAMNQLTQYQRDYQAMANTMFQRATSGQPGGGMVDPTVQGMLQPQGI